MASKIFLCSVVNSFHLSSKIFFLYLGSLSVDTLNTVVGIFKNSRNFGFVIPDNKKVIGTDIFISKKDFKKAKNNQKVVVQVTKMPTKDRKAEGKIVEVLGSVNQAGIDMMSLIREYDLPYEFPEAVSSRESQKTEAGKGNPFFSHECKP